MFKNRTFISSFTAAFGSHPQMAAPSYWSRPRSLLANHKTIYKFRKKEALSLKKMTFLHSFLFGPFKHFIWLLWRPLFIKNSLFLRWSVFLPKRRFTVYSIWPLGTAVQRTPSIRLSFCLNLFVQKPLEIEFLAECSLSLSLSLRPVAVGQQVESWFWI